MTIFTGPTVGTSLTTSSTTTPAPIVSINFTAISDGLQKLTDQGVQTASNVVKAPFKYINGNNPTQTSASEVQSLNTGKQLAKTAVTRVELLESVTLING